MTCSIRRSTGNDSLQPDLSTSSVLGQPLGKVQVARPVHVGVKRFKLCPKGRIGQSALVGLFELAQRVDEGFGNVSSTESTESSGKRGGGFFLSLFGRLDLGQRVRRGDGKGRGDFLGLVCLLVDLAVSSVVLGLPLADLSAVIFEVLGDFSLGFAVLDDGDDSRSDDNTIGSGSSDGFVMRSSGYTESDSKGDGSESLDSGNEFGQSGRHVAVSGRSGGSHLQSRSAGQGMFNEWYKKSQSVGLPWKQRR